MGTKLTIKFRTNASRLSHGSPNLAEWVHEHQDSGYQQWSQDPYYGWHWAIEGVFSAMKWTFGEAVRATSIPGMFHEI